MDKYIKGLKSLPLNGEQMMKLVDGKANLIKINDLVNYTNIDDVLGEHEAVILLYENKKNSGHWVTLYKVGKTTLYFFDPYGLDVDEQLRFGKYSQPYLGELINKSGYRLIHNKVDLQKYCKSVATCGKFVSFRLIFRNLPDKKFISLFLDNKCYDPDFWITVLCAFL